MGIEKINLVEKKDKKFSPQAAWVGGIAFTFLIALLGYVLAHVPGFHYVGQLACAILIAVVYRQMFGYPEALRSGIAFSSKRLLRAAIILYGLKLNIATVFDEGAGLIVRDAGVIMFSIFMTMWLAKLFKADKRIALLLGVGTGVCGAAAIVAVAPIIKSKDEDTAISVGMIALMGTVFAVTYTILRPLLPLDAAQYGIWSGMSLHEIAHVALAAEPAGEEVLALALLAKLGRVFLLVPLCFILIYVMKRKHQGSEEMDTKLEYPWFLVGFTLFSLLGSYVGGHSIPVSETMMNAIVTFTTWLLTAAMVGLGLNVNLKHLRTRAIRPLLAMTVTSVALSILVFFLV
ncbi:putative sulfate exporter family transporter [Bacillus sp. REN10]|uniref:YeiH family protein n=1 Tax=Bacillus sp. REN10 TaxID=2782541 RepID=UPI00193BF8B7|nr:putative sulfate exporter family transporter [Bacillus sp. REN10]